MRASISQRPAALRGVHIRAASPDGLGDTGLAGAFEWEGAFSQTARRESMRVGGVAQLQPFKPLKTKVSMGKGKAKRDKDKYYHLAKEQVRFYNI